MDRFVSGANLARGLERRAAKGRPVRVGRIGAGKFGSMFLAQARRTPGLYVVAIADRNLPKVRGLLADAGWDAEQLAAPLGQRIRHTTAFESR